MTKVTNAEIYLVIYVVQYAKTLLHMNFICLSCIRIKRLHTGSNQVENIFLQLPTTFKCQR